MIQEIQPGRYIVAVSGGVDSVVLLDMVAALPGVAVVVAHFDHGIREESADDALFVRELAHTYGLECETERVELGGHASEEQARVKRYAFLRRIAASHEARIMTAHHADDVVETIALNLTRGTGWRGLAVFGAEDIERPLTLMTKQEIHEYASSRSLRWREDRTNVDQRYLRNRLRRELQVLDTDIKRQLLALWRQQQAVVSLIDTETRGFLNETGEYGRSVLIHGDQESARELLRMMVYAKTGVSPTRPQADRALLAIKTAHPGARHDIGSRIRLVFTRTTFSIKAP